MARCRGLVPFARPPADDEAVLIEYAVQKSIVLVRIPGELGVGVEDARVLVVAMQLDQVAGCVRERFGSADSVYGVDDRRLHAAFSKRVFQEAIEVGGDDHADETFMHEVGDRKMPLGGNPAAALNILIGRLDIAVQDGPALQRRRAELGDELRVVRLLGELRPVPSRPVRLVWFALSKRDATNQVERHFPTL